jgi:anti-sigma B factor antagonist
MRTFTRDDTLLVTQFKNLGADNAFLFKEFVQAALTDQHKVVEVDLTTTDYVDSEGLGAMVWVHKRMCTRGGKVRLLNPRPMVRQFLALLRMDHLFEVASGEPGGNGGSGS